MEMSNVKISIVIPVYGVEQYIGQMLDSIQAQTYQDFEVIFVDDGSPDNCPKILDDFCRLDERYTVIHQKNSGVSIARNTGMAQARGEYLYLADSDDWLTENAMERLAQAAEETNADIIYGDWYAESSGASSKRVCFEHEFVTEDPDTIFSMQYAVTNIYKVKIRRPEFKVIYYFGGAPWRYMVKRSIVEENELSFDPTVKGLGDDILFALHVYEYVKKAAYIQTPIYHYRIIEGTYTRGYKSDLLEKYSITLSRMQQFISDYSKGEDTKKSFYIRTILYFDDAMNRYFKNENNPKNSKELFAEMKDTLRKEPYRTAVKKAPLKDFGFNRLYIRFMLLRLHFYRLYWLRVV